MDFFFMKSYLRFPLLLLGRGGGLHLEWKGGMDA